MLKTRQTFNTLMLLMALAVITQRVLTPFLVPPLLVHADGTIEICSWQGGSQRLLLNSQGERVESQQPDYTCPDCATSPAINQTSLSFLIKPLQFQTSETGHFALHSSHYLRPPTRAPPTQA